MENNNQKKTRRDIPINEGMHESNLRSSGPRQTSINDSIPMPPPKKKKKKKKTSVGLKVFLGVLIAFAVIIGAVVLYAVGVLTLYKPSVDSSTPSFWDPENYETDENNNIITPALDDNQFNFLVVARDKVSGLTDVMMIINYNITDQSLSVMQIPRDTYIELDDYYYHKINGAYSYYLNGRKGEANAERLALRDVADMLEKNLALKIHYTAQMNIDGFSDIVDAIGGVEMYVPQRMYYSDPDQDLYIDLYEGYQTLNGEKAEMFVRYRYGYANGDIGRGNAQKEFMTAFIKKVQSSISLTDINVITDLATTVYGCISTDLSLEDLIFFGKNFIGFGGGEKVDLENVRMLTMPGNAFSYGLSYYSINKEAVADVINTYFNVYNNIDITSSFDKDGIFYTEDSANSVRIYNLPKEELETEILTGEEIDENGAS